jgi:outer membrane biosynthesis protein TonB
VRRRRDALSEAQLVYETEPDQRTRHERVAPDSCAGNESRKLSYSGLESSNDGGLSMRGLVTATLSAIVTVSCVQPQRHAPAGATAPASETPAAPGASPALPEATTSRGATEKTDSAPTLPPATPGRTVPQPSSAVPASRPDPAPTPSRPSTASTRPTPAPAPAATPPKPNAPAGQPSPPASARTPPSVAPATPAAPPAAPKPPAAAAASPDPLAGATLDLAGLEQRLRDTDAIGVFTKLSLKNQVDDLLDQFRKFYKGQIKVPLADLRQRYELLLLKVVTLLQDADEQLANAVNSSREAIWGILSDPQKFSTI